ncbi:ATP-binding protein [Massilia endophytica]|nr:ATP-binding protein [Massilia endophytica]
MLLAEVKDYLDAGLRGGGSAIVIATEEHLSALRQQLLGLGRLEGEPAWFPGELIMLEASHALSQFMVGDWPDEQRFREVVGGLVSKTCARGKPVHAFGEMVAVLCGRGLYDAAVRLEQLWNALREEHRFSLFCAYPWHLFPNQERTLAFQHVCAEHDHVGVHTHGTGAQHVGHREAVLEQKVFALQAELAGARQSEQTLRHREQELVDFLEKAAEGIHRVAPDGTILWANTAELALLGYRWEEYIGHHIAEFHADQAEIQDILQRLHAGEILLDQPARMRCKDGAIKHVVINSNGCFEDGRLRYTRCFTRDATDRHLLAQTYREREALVQELSRANEAKDEFLAMLAHELRNPLAPISAAAQLVSLAPDEAGRVKQASAVILRQVAHMTSLIDDLLDVARVTRGLVVLNNDALDLREVIYEAVEQAAPRIRGQQQRLALDVPPESAVVRGDRKRLVQVVANLLSNAAKFTPANGEISIRLRLRENEVELAVADNGVGMEPDLVARVFGLFVQGHRTLDRAQGGLGIGLSLAKRLVESHGGTLCAASAGAGEGSTFTVTLPRVMHQPIDGASLAKLPVQRHGDSLRVIVVDDNRDAADTLAGLLSAVGHQSRALYCAEAAIEAAKSACPHVFMIDIGLPEMDGLALARRLTAMPEAANAVLIAVTGYSQLKDRSSSRAVGFQHHFVKPVDIAELLGLLAELTPATSS